MSAQGTWYWACHFGRTVSGEHLRALCRLIFAKPSFRGMLKGKQVLNHWALTPNCMISSNSSSTTEFISCLPFSLPNPLGLSLQNTSSLTPVLNKWARHWKAFLLPLNLSARKIMADTHCNLAFVCSNVCKRWIHYFPAGAFAVIHSLICVTR